MLRGTGKSYRQAKTLRRQLSLPEVLLWQRLRKTSLHWRKQHPVGPYILDFYCDAVRLCIEVDGEGHAHRLKRDACRDTWLAQHGIVTMRIPAAEVLGNMEGVLRTVAVHARERAPLHRPLDGPPPRAKLGED